MRTRFITTLTVGLAVALAGAGAATAMTTDSASTTDTQSSSASQDIGLPVPLPTESPIREVIKDVGTPGGDTGGSGGEEEPAEETPPAQTDGNDARDKTSTKSSKKKRTATAPTSSLGGAPLFGGWQRFFGMGEQMFGPPSSFGYYTETQTITTPVTSPADAAAPTVQIAPVASTLPQNPAYLWVLLPLGLMLLVAAGYAVFEPVRRPGRLALLVSSTRQSARQVPAGITLTAARGVIRVVRVLGGWAER